jgi:hypothetical protein
MESSSWKGILMATDRIVSKPFTSLGRAAFDRIFPFISYTELKKGDLCIYSDPVDPSSNTYNNMEVMFISMDIDTLKAHVRTSSGEYFYVPISTLTKKGSSTNATEMETDSQL